MTSFAGKRRHTGRAVKDLCIVSANLRGFHTNVGELTHRFILPNNADIVFVCETFLDSSVPHKRIYKLAQKRTAPRKEEELPSATSPPSTL